MKNRHIRITVNTCTAGMQDTVRCRKLIPDYSK